MTIYQDDDFVAVVATNDSQILKDCLMRSPDIETGRLKLLKIGNAKSMATAYNSALTDLKCRVCVFVHQDVYLPRGWLDRARTHLDRLEEAEAGWKIAGPYGVMGSGDHVGRIWDVTLGRELGRPGFSPTHIESLDELLIIYRNDGPPKFDPNLPDFHMYGTDIVQSSLVQGRGAFVIELPVVHNNRPIESLGGGFTQAYRYMTLKWRDRLPINTTICQLAGNPFSLFRARWRRRHVRIRPKGLLADAVATARAAGYE